MTHFMVGVPPGGDRPLSSPGGRSAAITVIAGVAGRCGAFGLAHATRALDPSDGATWQILERLRLQLHLHLQELRNGIDRPEHELVLQLDTIEEGLAAARALIAARAPVRADHRDKLERSLEVSRTRFLMGTKADALLELEERLGLERGRGLLRRRAVDIAVAIARRLVEQWQCAQQPELDLAVRQMGERLLHDARGVVQPHVDRVPTVSLLDARITVSPAPVAMRTRRHPSGALTRLADGLRRRVARVAASELVWSLETNSRLAIEDSLARLDAATDELELALVTRLEQLAETARGSLTCSRQARTRSGRDRELQRIDALTAELE